MNKRSVLLNRALLLSALILAIALVTGAVAFRLAYRPQMSRAARSRILYQAEELAALAESGNASRFNAAAEVLIAGGGQVWCADAGETRLMAGDAEEMPARAEEMLRRAMSGESESRLMKFDGKDHLFCAVTLMKDGAISGALLVALPASAPSAAVLMWIAFVIALIAAAGAAYPLANFLVAPAIQPIRELRDVAVRMAGGDFEARAGEHPGEMGELAEAVNNLSHKLSRNMYMLIVERNRLKHVLNGLSEGIIAVSDKGHITHKNPAVEKMFPKPKSDKVRGTDARNRVIPDPSIWEAFDAVIRTRAPQTRTVERSGSVIRITISPMIDELGVMAGAVGLFSDITQQERLEHTRREYVANVSHEMRTPLTAVRALIEPLRDGMVTTEEQRLRYYDIIMREVMRLSRLINDQLELSRLQSGTLAIEKSRIPLDDLVYDLCDRYSSIAEEKNLSFDLATDFSRAPSVWSNADRLEQLMVILLDNAIKYTEAGGLTVSADWDEERVVMHIRDTGIGITPENLEHVFERFYKVDKAHSGMGSGLGLSIAKELLTFMGEDIWVESTPGKGTTFSFTVARNPKPDKKDD